MDEIDQADLVIAVRHDGTVTVVKNRGGLTTTSAAFLRLAILLRPMQFMTLRGVVQEIYRVRLQARKGAK